VSGGGEAPEPVVRQLLGISIHALTLQQALDRIDVAIRERQRLQIGVVNAAKIANMSRDPELRRDVLSSDLILADGTSVVWASRLLGQPLPERVAGIDLMLGMLRRGSERGYRVFCLGATPEVLEAATARIQASFPGVRLVGRHHGYFSDGEEREVAQKIEEARPDILLIAMTSPRKERFLARWSSALGVPVGHGVGGSFDVLAGKVRRAPEAWQRLGLEWLFRVKEEPGRLWRRYLVTNLLFVKMVLSELLGRLWRR
jgi:N-acetylglucosaminyldiphosphoundecaprenol N-acetyl-beta-D-mannosaminyltransferase